MSVNEILAGKKVDTKNLEKISNENILNLTKKEIENLKAVKMGTLGMTVASSILIIYGLINNLDINVCLILLAVYNGVYKYGKYKYNSDKADFQLSIVTFSCRLHCLREP